MITEKRKANVGDNILVINNDGDFRDLSYNKYQKVMFKILKVSGVGEKSIVCEYNNDSYGFLHESYEVVVNHLNPPTNNNPLKIQEFMNMLIKNAQEYSYRDLLEYNNISNEELEEIDEWFAKFEIQI